MEDNQEALSRSQYPKRNQPPHPQYLQPPRPQYFQPPHPQYYYYEYDQHLQDHHQYHHHEYLPRPQYYSPPRLQHYSYGEPRYPARPQFNYRDRQQYYPPYNDYSKDAPQGKSIQVFYRLYVVEMFI